jgi:hemin uptake protein HemP
MSDSAEHDQPPDPKEEAPAPRIIAAERLFEGQREIYIEHDGERYRLRITRRGKLILQK